MKNIHGYLTVYDASKRLTAIISDSRAETGLIFVGGLTDSFYCVKYLGQLAQTLTERGKPVAFIQPMLSSSGIAYGLSSLDQDVTEIATLIQHLRTTTSMQRFVLMGHSTGCNDIVHFSNTYDIRAQSIVAGILQAPVSDRDYHRLTHTAEEAEAEISMAANHALDEYLPVALNDGLPIKPARFLSLVGEKTSEDLFSADLPVDYMRERFSRLSVPTLVIWSSNDEYVPQTSHNIVPQAVRDALPDGRLRTINANHACDGNADDVVRHVSELLDDVA